MTGPSILVLGVGRSGTTAMFSLLQTLVEHKFNAEPAYYYEPFLWDSAKLPRHAREFDDQFSYMRTLSAQGIHHHLELPILATSQTEVSAWTSDFLTTVSRCPADKPALLTKMIRATGRSTLLRQASPNARMLLLIRNPVAVINSIVNMFSLYGEDFHESDYLRFRAEVKTLYPDEADLLPSTTSVEREAYYWFFTNLHFLRSSAHDPAAKVVVYEQYVENRAATLVEVSEFLDLDLTEQIVEESLRPVGWVSDTNLTAREIDQLRPFEDAYHNLLLPEISTSTTAKGAPLAGNQANEDQFLDIRQKRENLRGRGPLFLVDEVIRAKIKKSEYISLQEKLASARQLQQSTSAELADAVKQVAQTQTKLAQTDSSLAKVRAEAEQLQQSVSELEAKKESISAYLTTLSTAFEKLLPISFWRHPMKKFRAYRQLATAYTSQTNDQRPDSTEDKT